MPALPCTTEDWDMTEVRGGVRQRMSYSASLTSIWMTPASKPLSQYQNTMSSPAELLSSSIPISISPLQFAETGQQRMLLSHPALLAFVDCTNGNYVRLQLRFHHHSVWNRSFSKTRDLFSRWAAVCPETSPSTPEVHEVACRVPCSIHSTPITDSSNHVMKFAVDMSQPSQSV